MSYWTRFICPDCGFVLMHCMCKEKSVIAIRKSVGLPLRIPCGHDRRQFLHLIFDSQIASLKAKHLARGLPLSMFEPIVAGIRSCGTKIVWQSVDDMPLEDMPCPCGDPNHWIVTWEEA